MTTDVYFSTVKLSCHNVLMVKISSHHLFLLFIYLTTYWQIDYQILYILILYILIHT